ncbi:hypothetical protein EUX98_g512 [Antrodiella citrinella]|uniref:Uncharacterized protein n=1 Tax=Antrodiella citrinella TaxID=2447956 RepID=A0A4S4N3I6_9APHY|nr:hypothetical protein EUX98_g512 [Antrodiella citrinella]
MDDYVASGHDAAAFTQAGTLADTGEGENHASPSDSRLISYIRSTIAKSPIGSLFSLHADVLQHALAERSNAFKHTIDLANTLQTTDWTVAQNSQEPAAESNVTTPRRLSHNNPFTEVKQTLTKLKNRKRSGSMSSVVSVPSLPQSSSNLFQTRIRANTISTTTILSTSSLQSSSDDTPPLTPESLSSQPSSVLSSISVGPLINQALACIQGGDARPRTRQESEDIREGKKPERPICYDVLIADISNDNLPQYRNTAETSPADNLEEWFGLDYTLEMSRNERQMLECSNHDDGEFSKSHKSWAAIHGGFVNPAHGYADFCRWKRWHRALDRQSEKRRIQRTFDFLNHSKEMSEIYVDEVTLRRWFEWSKLEHGDGPYLNDLKAELSALSRYRPDPYYPPVKRNLAWALCRSRSSSCLRELQHVSFR